MIAKSKKAPRKRSFAYIVLYFYMVMILLAVLTVASYTWLTLSRTPRVSNLRLNISAFSGMELSLAPDTDTWTRQLSYEEMVPETSPLRPVTWSEKEQKFYGAVYGMDGRLTGNWVALSDERNANRDSVEGYYCIGTFYARTDDTVQVSLTPAVAVDEGGTAGSGTFVIGTPIWNSELTQHENGGKGAECAVRIGIRINRLDDSYEPIEEELEEGESPLFFIYEPNSETHVGATNAPIAADTAGYYVNTPSIDGTATLVESKRLIPQSTTTWAEADPPLRDTQVFTFGNFFRKIPLFILEEGETVQIQMYIWLEGQDMDCTNAIADAQLTANIQFLAEPFNQSGIVDKDDMDEDEDDEDLNYEDFKDFDGEDDDDDDDWDDWDDWD